MPGAAAGFAIWEWSLLCALFCIPPLIGMARHPLWIDETITLLPVPVETPSLRAFFFGFLHFEGSLRYTPLYMFLVAAWGRIVSPTELGLRCVNLPFLLGIACLSRALVWRLPLRSAAARWACLGFIALSPFYLYYSYDLRPYAALMCFGGMMLVGLVFCEEWDARGPWLLSIGFCLAFLTQPPVVLLAPLLALGVLFSGFRDVSRLLRAWAVPGVVGGLITAGTGWYYHIVRSGGGMPSWGGGGFVKNLAFILYEFAGLSGLGPTRSQLRALAPPSGFVSTIEPVHLTWLDWLPVGVVAVIWLLASCLAVGAAMKARPFRAPTLRWSALLFACGMLVLSAFFFHINYRFLSRHVSFLYLPFVFMLIALAAQTEWRLPVRVIYGLLFAGLVTSSAQLLFNPAQLRDDPRSVVHTWRAAQAADPAVRLWAFYPIHSVLYYMESRDVLWIGGESVALSSRIGPASYEQKIFADQSAADFSHAPVVCLVVPSRAMWEKLLAGSRGQRVILAINRGTEFDVEGLAQELIANPAARAKRLGVWPFVECYECVVP